VDYWDGRHFGTELAAKLRTPSDKFPTDFKDATVPGNASSKIRAAANRLQAAFGGNDAKAAAALFTSDAVYEDMTLRTQILGRLAIELLSRALAREAAGGNRLLDRARRGWRYGRRLRVADRARLPGDRSARDHRDCARPRGQGLAMSVVNENVTPYCNVKMSGPS